MKIKIRKIVKKQIDFFIINLFFIRFGCSKHHHASFIQGAPRFVE